MTTNETPTPAQQLEADAAAPTPIAWFDAFNGAVYTEIEEAQLALDGGNKVVPVYHLSNRLTRALAALEAVESEPAAYMHDYGDRVRVVWNTAWSKYPAGTKFYADGPADAVEVSRDD